MRRVLMHFVTGMLVRRRWLLGLLMRGVVFSTERARSRQSQGNRGQKEDRTNHS
ncbi:MAG: hypothetical protein ACREXP_29315 [Steroidobacteraceae bacterium]